MWIITSKGFIAVSRSSSPDREVGFIVRARQDGLLEELAAEAGVSVRVYQDEHSDCPNWASVSEDELLAVIWSQVKGIGGCLMSEPGGDLRVRSLLPRVWSVISALGTGKFYGVRRRVAPQKPNPVLNSRGLSPEEAFLGKVPKSAFLEDGAIDPDYLKGLKV